MNYTENYHLPQWVKSDRIMMEDFNDAMANIDEGMTGIAQAAEEGISNAASNAAAAAAEAQSTADTALANAANAQAKADAAYAPDQPPYVVGSYTGTGDYQNIILGFRPSFVIVTGAQGGHAHSYSRAAGTASAVGNLSFNDNGFSVSRNGIEGASETIPHLVESGMVYAYIAFR